MERTEHPSPVRTVILDAGPIIHLDEIGCLSLLLDFDELLIPAAVWDEVERHRPTALHNRNTPFTKSHAVAAQADADALALRDAFSLDRGEAEAISLCFLHRHALLLTDDAAVRLAVTTSVIRVHSTIGILIRAIRRKQLTPAEVIRRLEDIPAKSTLFIKRSLLKQIIEKVKKKAAF